MAIILAGVIAYILTRHIWFNYGWESYNLAILFVVSWAVLAKLFSYIARSKSRAFSAIFSPTAGVLIAGIVTLALAYQFLADYWYFVVLAGVALIIIVWLWPLKDTPLPALPAQWDERAIRRGVHRYRANSGALVTYIDEIKQRFVTGQQQETAKARLEFLQTLAKMYETGHEVYGWERRLFGKPTQEEEILTGRVEIEEKTKDIEAENAKELAQLRGEADREELRLRITRTKQEQDTPPQREKTEDEKAHEAERDRVTRLGPQFDAAQDFRKSDKRRALRYERDRRVKELQNDKPLTPTELIEEIKQIDRDYQEALKKLSEENDEDSIFKGGS